MSRRAVSAAPRGDMSSEIHPWPGWKDARSQLTSQCEAKFGAPRVPVAKTMLGISIALTAQERGHTLSRYPLFESVL